MASKLVISEMQGNRVLSGGLNEMCKYISTELRCRTSNDMGVMFFYI